MVHHRCLGCAPQITLSADHYAYVSPSAEAPFSQRRAVAAGDVARGDLLWAAGGGGGAMTVQPVADVASVVAQGLVNPFTMRGAPNCLSSTLSPLPPPPCRGRSLPYSVTQSAESCRCSAASGLSTT